MSGRRAGTIAVLVNNLDGVFQRSVLAGVEEAADLRNLSVRAHTLAGMRPDAVRALVGETRGAAAGIIVLSSALSDADLRVLAENGAPVTLISHQVGGVVLPSIMFDNHQGVGLLMRHVVAELGRRSLVFVGGDPSQLDAREREAAFRDEALRHGLFVPAANFLEGGFTPKVAGASLQAFLEAGGLPDAVVAADYLMAIKAVETLRQAGRVVPDEVVVVGFGDGPEAEEAGVTTVAADVVELGRRALRQLAAQLGSGRLAGSTLLSTHLVVRASSGTARKRA